MIVRVRKANNYTAIPNAVYQNKSYSLEMRGAHVSLLTKPNDWILRNAELERLWGCGHNKVQQLLKEMEVNGLMRRVRTNNEGGRIEWERIVYESPDLNPEWAGARMRRAEGAKAVKTRQAKKYAAAPITRKAAAGSNTSKPRLHPQYDELAKRLYAYCFGCDTAEKQKVLGKAVRVRVANTIKTLPEEELTIDTLNSFIEGWKGDPATPEQIVNFWYRVHKAGQNAATQVGITEITDMKERLAAAKAARGDSYSRISA